MSRRQLLGGAAILAVIATAFWYVVVAPSRGSAVEPDSGSVRVALSATAAGTGTWVRYLVTVKNLADGDFVGDVLLEDQDQDGQDASSPPSLSSLLRNPRLPAAPVVAAESAYRVHLTVASRTSRTVAVMAPDFFNVVEAVMGGRQLDAQPVDHAAVLPIAVLSGVEGPAEAILGLHYDRFSPRVARFDSARGFPSNPLLLAGYTTIVVDQFDTAALSEAQVQAVREFVGFGGTLVLAGGSAWRQTIAPLPADLLPVRPTATGTAGLAPLAALAGVNAEARSAPAAVGALRTGARAVLDSPEGHPLVAELSYGAGKVVELTYDPGGDANGQTPYGALGWQLAVGRGIDQIPGSGPMAASLLGPDAGFTALLPAAGDAPLPSLWLVGLVLVVYVALAGPLGYLLARRRLGQPALFWAMVPLVAFVFTGLFYLVGSSLQGSLQDREIQVVRVGPGQSVNVLEYHRILFLRRGDHRVVPAANSLVAPLTLEAFRATGSTCDRCTSQLGALPSGGEHVVPGQQPVVEESGVWYGSVRVVASSEVGLAPVGLEAQLAVHGGRVQGTLVNGGPKTVWQLQLFSTDGQSVHRADLAVGLPPGGRATIDAPLQPADAPRQSLTAETVLLRAVAATTLTARGQAVLVGLTEPLPSRLTVDGQAPPGAGLAVVQQTIPLTEADGAIRDVERKWLASASGDQKAGFVGVYDLLVPKSGQPLQLTYDRQWASSMEVYDWARGVFVPVRGQGGDPTRSAVGLTGDQVRDGMVRVRLHEPRISWGINVWIDTATTG